MRHSFFVPLVLLVLLALLFSVSAPPVKAADSCSEGERRVCGSDVGACEAGRSVCKDGKWVICQGATIPRETDICGNGIDDDCNGIVDDNCFPWISLVLVGVGIFFIGLGLYYMQHQKGQRILREGISKD